MTEAGSGLLPGFEACAVLARTRGRAELAASIWRLGTAIESGVILSFDDEADASRVAAELEQPPFVGELAAALVAATLFTTLGDTECAGYALLRLFRARQPDGDASFMTPTLLAALVEAPVAFDEHEGVLRWAFATLAPAERARWAASLAAANENIGLETTGGWLAEASACVADDDEFARLVERAYVEFGLDAEDATRAIAALGR